MAISIPWLQKRKAKTGRVGLAVGPDGLAAAHINADGKLAFCQFLESVGDTAERLAQLVDEQGWEGVPCSVVLHPVYYQLLLADSPQVESAEVSAALRWKIKDLLDFPIEDAAIAHFLLPEDAYRGRQKKLYAGVLRKTSLQSLVEPVEISGLQVDCIEVSELALHNIISRLPQAGGGIAMMQLHEGEGFINLVEDGAVYLTRRLDIGLEKYNANADNTVFFDSLFLEVQRSLDFYESQLGKGIITRLFYSPGLEHTAAIGEFLSRQLGIDVSPLDLSPLGFVEDESGQQARCSSAIGAALGPNQREAVRAAS